jgi:lysophospholipid acyltransferase (LPLAT)-like uncharacterized protein
METASSQTPDASRPKPKAGGVVVPHKPKWYQRVLAWLVFAAIRSVAMTLRYRVSDNSDYYKVKPTGPAIYCVWHNRLALCMIAYWDFAHKWDDHTPGMAAMVSASKDGGFLAGILDCFRVEPVRGSSSRRGPQALLELTTWAGRGYDLAITPDGPRGPCYVVQEGVMSLAQLTGLPILPFSCNVDWKIKLKSWDRFQISLPFSRCEVAVAKPIRVPREATDAEREALRQELEKSLRAITRD